MWAATDDSVPKKKEQKVEEKSNFAMEKPGKLQLGDQGQHQQSKVMLLVCSLNMM